MSARVTHGVHRRRWAAVGGCVGARPPPCFLKSTSRLASSSELQVEDGAARRRLGGKNVLAQLPLCDAPRLHQPLEVARLDLRAERQAERRSGRLSEGVGPRPAVGRRRAKGHCCPAQGAATLGNPASGPPHLFNEAVHLALPHQRHGAAAPAGAGEARADGTRRFVDLHQQVRHSQDSGSALWTCNRKYEG